MARGASTGFMVLFIGGLAAPLVVGWLPAAGPVWLILISVVGFAAAGWRVGAGPSPAPYGAIAAAVGYLLAVPLILISGGGFDVGRSGLMLLAAVAVGGAAGYLTGRTGSDAAGQDTRAPRRGRSG